MVNQQESQSLGFLHCTTIFFSPNTAPSQMGLSCKCWESVQEQMPTYEGVDLFCANDLKT